MSVHDKDKIVLFDAALLNTKKKKKKVFFDAAKKKKKKKKKKRCRRVALNEVLSNYGLINRHMRYFFLNILIKNIRT